jgi:hypothetical protein
MKAIETLTAEMITSAKVIAVFGAMFLAGLIVPAVIWYGWPWAAAFGFGGHVATFLVIAIQSAAERLRALEEAREAEGLAAMLDRELSSKVARDLSTRDRKETLQ